jgi:serine/threonine protein kinase
VAAINIAMENCSKAGRLDYTAANCSLQTHCGNSSTRVQPTATTDRVCNGPPTLAPPTGGSSSAPISTGDTVLIVLAVLVAVVVIAYLLSRQRGLTKVLEHNETLHEQLLEEHKEQRGDLEESQALNSRMRGAWEIEFCDVELGPEVAAGAAGRVHTGGYAGHRVAVKVLRQPLDPKDDPVGAEDFARECATLMSIRHTRLLIFYGAGTMPDGRPFMVTEFMALGSLKHVLADPARALGWDVRTRIAAQVADGMAYLHGLKIVHRDFKSDNVLLNDELDAKVADFGTSKLVTESRTQLETAETAFGGGGGGGQEQEQEQEQEQSAAFQATMTKGVGTPLWMAPELFVGGTKYGPEVDVYSFGVVMWELATRKVPWAEKIAETRYILFFAALSNALEQGERPHVPVAVAQAGPAFVALMRECWATDPAARPAAAAAAALLHTLAAAQQP